MTVAASDDARAAPHRPCPHPSGNRVAELPWATALERGRLLAAHLEELEDQVAQAGRTSRPVILDRADIRAVEDVVGRWFTEVGLEGAPEGLVALEEALQLTPARGNR
jgi:hypothetical protein